MILKRVPTFVLPGHIDWINRIGKQHNAKTLDDWYDVRTDSVLRRGSHVLQCYGGSLHKTLMALYPYFKWELWKFRRAPSGFWDDLANQRRRFDTLAEEFGFKTVSDWAQVTYEDIIRRAGFGISNRYNSRLKDILKTMYPGHSFVWNITKRSSFKRKPKQYEMKQGLKLKEPTDHILANQRDTFENIAQSFGVKVAGDWLDNAEDVTARVNNIVKKYYGTLSEALKTLYPAYEWTCKRERARVRRGHWTDQHNVSDFLHQLEKDLNISSVEAWYRVSTQQVTQKGGGVLKMFSRGLEQRYPCITWQFSELAKANKRAKQRALLQTIKRILVDYDVIEEYNLDIAQNGVVTLDVYVPKLSIAFEYQGEQHYKDIPSCFGSSVIRGSNDMAKLNSCIEQGITLISVPFWKKIDEGSMLSTIRQYLPQLKLDVSRAINLASSLRSSDLPYALQDSSVPIALMTPASV